MYRKFLSAILFGALTIASTSTFVSCKDYDDDIDALNARVDANDADNKALHDALDAANQELASLKAKLAQEVARLDGLVAAAQGTADQAIKDAAAAQKTADQAVKDAAAAQSTADQALKLSEENKKAIADEIIRATAAEAALEVRIQKLEDVVIPELRKLIKDLDDKKLDKATFNEEVKKIYAQMEAIETELGKALKRIGDLEEGLKNEIAARKALAEDLEQQKEIIKKHGERLDNLENEVVPELRKLIKDLRDDYEADVKRIDGEISTLKDRVTKNEGDIKDLQDAVQKINEELDKINNKLNELNVLILRSLRSIVFIPDFYYWGIEATELSGVYYKYWELKDMPSVNANTNDPTWDNSANKTYCYDHKGHKAERKEAFLVENFVANYHLNPSSADLSKAKINVLQADRKYRTKAGADKANTNIQVASFDYEKDIKNGDLSLNLNIIDPAKIKKIGHVEDGAKGEGRHFVQDADEDLMVTTFAVEVELNDEMKNTVTSDYAALLATTYANGYRLAHTNVGDPDVKGAGLTSSYTKVVNNTGLVDPTPGHEAIVCRPCNINLANRHLFTDADETVYGDVQEQVVTLEDQPLVSALGETGSTTTAQDIVVWNSTINLSKLAEVHRIGDENTPEKLVSASEMTKNGFEIRFELTGILMTQNATSESAHAAIKQNEDGDYILRPQLPKMAYQEDGKYKGEAAEWEKTAQDRTTIGRTPLVRVLLVDTKHDNRVLDYGYIRLVIIDTPKVIDPELETFRTVEYQTGISYYKEWVCDEPAGEKKSWTQTWASFENDLYNMFNLPQVEFEAEYDSVLVREDFPMKTKYGHHDVDNTMKQYLMKISAKGDTTFVECKDDEYLGQIYTKIGENIGAGTKTQVITWEITAAEIAAFAKDKQSPSTRVVKYEVVGNTRKYEDVYVILKAGDIAWKELEPEKPTVTGKFDTNKIVEYWYDENTQKTKNTLHEAHLNVPSPEDWIDTWGESRTCPFEFLLSSDFQRKNPVTPNYILDEDKLDQYIIVDDKTPNKMFALSKAEKNFGFVVLSKDANGFKANEKAVGYSGTKYTLFVGDLIDEKQEVHKNWALYAYVSSKRDAELIAYLRYDGTGQFDINHIYVVLNKDAHRADHINSYIEDLINAKHHLDLTDDFLKVLLGYELKWSHNNPKCAFETIIPAFQVRFLRPINMFSEDLMVEDAANTTQIFPLYDLVKFTDWREQWNPVPGSDINKERRERVVPDGGKFIVDYWYYYNIKHIIVGNATRVVPVDEEAPLNDYMKTNMNGSDISKDYLSTVSNNVEFTYVPPTEVIDAEHPQGTPSVYGSIKYTNNRSTVDDFDVTVPVTVCYEWGHLYMDVKIQVRKTIGGNTNIKVRR